MPGLGFDGGFQWEDEMFLQEERHLPADTNLEEYSDGWVLPTGDTAVPETVIGSYYEHVGALLYTNRQQD